MTELLVVAAVYGLVVWAMCKVSSKREPKP